MSNSSPMIRYCRVITAVTALAVILSIFDLTGLVGTVVKYSVFLLLTAFVGFDFKERSTPIPLAYTAFCTCLILSLTIIISWVLPAPSQSVRLDTLGIISAVILAPVFEELFFRGALISFSKPGFSWIFSSVIFALFHGGAFFQTLLLGLALSYFYITSKKISVSIICHMANNILALICMHYDIRLPVFATAVVLAVIIGVKYEKKVL